MVSRHFPKKKKKNVISFSRKRICAFGLGLGLELAEMRLNKFSIKRLFGQVY